MWLLLLTAAAYLPCLTGAFVYDDLRFIEHNPFMDGPFDGIRIFTDPGTMEALPTHDIYRPVRTLFFYAERYFGCGGTLLHHLVGLLIHLLNTWLVYRLILLIVPDPRPALMGAGLFALHPVQAESVAWISSRADQLVACFVLLTLIQVLRSRNRRYVLTFLLTALACLSKESGVITGGFLLLAWLCFEAWRNRTVALHAVVSLGTAALYLVARAQVLSGLEGQVPLYGQGRVENFFTGLYSLGCQTTLLFTPWRMSVDYPGTYFDTLPLRVWIIGSVFLAVTLAVLLLLWKLRYRKALFGFLFTLVALLPTSSLVFPLRSLINDRYLYLAMAGVGTLAAAGLSPWPARRIRSAGIGLLLLLAVFTGLRCLEWRDGERLWRSTLSVHPDSVKARIGLSRFLFNDGQIGEALEQAQEAVAMTAPGSSMNADARLLAAQSLNRMGRPDAAAEQLRLALSEADTLGNAHTFSHRLKTMSENLWSLEMKAGRYEAALSAAQIQVKYAGETAIGLVLQAQARRRMGGVKEAEAVLRRAAALDGDCAEVHLELAELLEETGRSDEARSELEKGLELKGSR